MKLHVRGRPIGIPAEYLIGRVIDIEEGQRSQDLLVECLHDDTRLLVCLTDATHPYADSIPTVSGLHDVTHLHRNDIVLIRSTGDVNTLFRENSHHNSLFVTDRCNSNCLMCSQPPRDRDDTAFFFDVNMKLLDLIPSMTQNLGITGGEPTLLGERLPAMIARAHDRLPIVEVDVLTNGRAFAWKDAVRQLEAIDPHRAIFCVPLYSDYYALHDYVVQASNAFTQTILGLHNLARFGYRVEIRIVLHKQVIPRLRSLATFINRNLPFAEHVAFMGLEYTGYTPHNDGLLWIEPDEYHSELQEAVEYLVANQMNVSIYNLPLCILPNELWKY